MADIREVLTQLGLPNYGEGTGAQLQARGVSAQGIGAELSYRDSLYRGLFETLVGRAPNENELRTIYDNVATRNTLGTGSPDQQTQLRNLASQYIGDTFQGAAKDYANQQLEGQKQEATRLSDLFRTQGRQAIADTETQLMDYQNRLFERLRPNLITSLQAQGLLNSGGLNQAMAGAQADLATSAQGALIDARLANEQQANAIQFAGQAAPYEYNRANALNSLDYMRGQGQNALNNNFQTFLTNLNFQNQMALQQQKMGGGKGGFFSQVGNAFAPTFGAQLGQNFANFALPNYTSGTTNQATGRSTQGSGLAALFM